jgi:hypothetical protein
VRSPTLIADLAAESDTATLKTAMINRIMFHLPFFSGTSFPYGNNMLEKESGRWKFDLMGPRCLSMETNDRPFIATSN